MNFFITTPGVIGLIWINCFVYFTSSTKLHPHIHDFNPLRNLQAQRRQGYGYSSSIVHYTPGDNAQHAKSEIKVNMNMNNEIIRQPKNSNNNDLLNSKSYHKQSAKSTKSNYVNNNNFEATKQLFHPQLPNQMQIQPQKGILHYNINEPQQKSVAPKATNKNIGQNSFNVGYSIGFGTPSESSNRQPVSGFMELQKFTPEIVTGTPNEKVLKPMAFQSELKPKDYVINAMESYQKQGIQMPFTKQNIPKKVDKTNYNNTPFKYHKYEEILSDSTSLDYAPKSLNRLKLNAENTPSVYKQSSDDSTSFGWKSISPTLEISSGGNSNINLNTARNSNTNSLTVTSKHTNGHTLVPSSLPQQYFDHAQALGHSQGFDYSNAVNLEATSTPALNTHLIHENAHHTVIAQNQVQQQSPVTFKQSASQIEQQTLEDFYKQNQPVSLNWFNNQDAITKATTKDLLLNNQKQQPTSQPSAIQLKTLNNINNNGLSSVKNNQYPNSLPIDTRLLSPIPYLTTTPIQQTNSNILPIHFDTNLLKKALLSNSNNGQLHIMSNDNPSQPNSVYTIPGIITSNKQTSELSLPTNVTSGYHPFNDVEIASYQQTNENHKSVRQDSNYNKPKDNKRHYYHQYPNYPHEQRNTGGSSNQQQPTSQWLFRNQQAQSSASDQQGSHSKPVNSIMPVEQIIQGKHKKPGVVRHPRVLNNVNNDNDMLPRSSSIQLNTKNLSNHGQQSHNQFNLNTTFRPPSINFIIKKISS